MNPEIRATLFGENKCINLGATTIVKTDPIENITKRYPKPVYSTPIWSLMSGILTAHRPTKKEIEKNNALHALISEILIFNLRIKEF